MIRRMTLSLVLLTSSLGCGILFPPIVPPGPTPDPPGPVIVVTGLRVLIVRETADPLPPSQSAIFTSAPFRKFIREHKAALRIWDDEVDAANESDQEFVKMLAVPRASLPWIVIAGGSKVVSQPLPKTVDETEALIAGAK